VAIPVVGAPARKVEAALGTLQDVLGEHHDCVVAEAWLRRAATGPDADSADALAAGELIGLQRAEATRLRGEWRAAWKAAKRTGRTRWLS
jgi:CHAD domain-containing protein